MEGLSELYATHMKFHDLGRALYHPVALKIGDCGYFNTLGHWNPIGNITSSESLSKHKLKTVQELDLDLDRAPVEEGHAWGPVLANDVKGTNIGGGVGASGEAAGIPVTAKLQVEYTSTAQFGAVLVALPPIQREAYYHYAPFQEWARANAKAIMSCEIWQDIEKYGLCVITQTYATKKYTLTAWNAAGRSAYLGFDIEVPAGGVLSPNVKWYEGNSVEGWHSQNNKDGAAKVVFVSGILCNFQKRILSKDPKVGTEVLRGEGVGECVPINGDEEYVLQFKQYGTELKLPRNILSSAIK